MDLRKAAEKVLLNWDYDIDSIQMGEAIESLRQALEQPQEWKTCRHCGFQYRPPKEDKWHPLAQPEQEPVAIVNEGMGGIEWLIKPLPDDTPLYATPVDVVNMSQKRVDETAKREHETIAGMFKETLPEQNPPSWVRDYNACLPTSVVGKAIRHTPPNREWQGLTDEEIEQGLLRSDYALQTAHAWRSGVIFAMTKLKEKNNG